MAGSRCDIGDKGGLHGFRDSNMFLTTDGLIHLDVVEMKGADML